MSISNGRHQSISVDSHDAKFVMEFNASGFLRVFVIGEAGIGVVDVERG